MRIVTWSDEMALGIAEIDADHAALLKIVQDIEAALCSSKDQPDLHEKVVHLFRFADEHFTREDGLMDRLPPQKYAEHIDAHRQMHVGFLARIAGLCNRTAFGDGVEGFSGSDKTTLTDLVLEMVSTDREMTDHLAEEGLI